jgi:biotin transport system substrate-specific component
MSTTFFAATILRSDDFPASRTLQQGAAIVFLTLLTSVAAQISIPLPFTPVPLTLQPMVVLLGAAALGSRLGVSAQVCYLAIGILGFPVFAASPVLPQGVGRLLGPTGGYLMAYPLAALVAGSLAERGFDRRYFTAVIAMACGLGVVFAGGVSWLALAHPSARALGWSAALTSGFYPFIGVDLLKLLVAAGVMPALWRLTGFRN